MKIISFAIITLYLATACVGNKKKDPLRQWLASPEEIMKQKSSIGLLDSQVMDIEMRYRKSKPTYDSLKIILDGRISEMQEILRQHPVNELKAKEKLRDILILENELKTLQLSVYVFAKNRLTKDQFNKLKK